MAPPSEPPLPLAPDRAAKINHISLLIASKSSVLKSMGISSSINRPTPERPSTSTHDNDQQYNNDDDDLVRDAAPNEGLSYIPDKAQAKKDAVSKEDRLLRGRILGKRKADGSLKTGRGNESDEDDEPGKSSLGKRKRPRKPAGITTNTEELVPPPQDDEPVQNGDDVDMGQKNTVDDETVPEPAQKPTASTEPEVSISQQPSGPKKEKRKKKKRKKGGSNNGQGPEA
jgi:hypothetical protein